MKEIITDLSLLENSAEPLTFITKDGSDLEEGKAIIADLKEVFDTNNSIYALAAPQIGINKRIFGIKFDDKIKFFINPIVTKKTGLSVAPETFASMPNKEILIGRPDEITVVYYTDEFKYEDNKLLGAAARVFDQMAQLLDGVLPSELGLVSDINDDGPLGELTEDEIKEVTGVWKQFVGTKLKSYETEIKGDEDLAKHYNNLLFSESVINGRTTVMETETESQAATRRAVKRERNKAEFREFVRRKK